MQQVRKAALKSKKTEFVDNALLLKRSNEIARLRKIFSPKVEPCNRILFHKSNFQNGVVM